MFYGVCHLFEQRVSQLNAIVRTTKRSRLCSAGLEWFIWELPNGTAGWIEFVSLRFASQHHQSATYRWLIKDASSIAQLWVNFDRYLDPLVVSFAGQWKKVAVILFHGKFFRPDKSRRFIKEKNTAPARKRYAALIQKQRSVKSPKEEWNLWDIYNVRKILLHSPIQFSNTFFVI